jgi:hypothetical protein
MTTNVPHLGKKVDVVTQAITIQSHKVTLVDVMASEYNFVQAKRRSRSIDLLQESHEDSGELGGTFTNAGGVMILDCLRHVKVECLRGEHIRTELVLGPTLIAEGNDTLCVNINANEPGSQLNDVCRVHAGRSRVLQVENNKQALHKVTGRQTGELVPDDATLITLLLTLLARLARARALPLPRPRHTSHLRGTGIFFCIDMRR